MKLLLLSSLALVSSTSIVNAQQNPLNRISCSWDSRNNRRNIVQRCDRRNDGRNWPYSCEDGRQVCCTESYINEPDLKEFGLCERVGGGPPAPVRPTRKPTNRRPDAPANSLQCIAPQERRIRREGHRSVCQSLPGNEVPYSCDTGVQLCCNRSNMEKATFNQFGTCRKTHFSEGPPEVEDMNIDNEEVEANLLDLGAHINCNFGGHHNCPRGRSPYTCGEEGEKACCAISSNNKKRNRKAIREMMREVNVPGHGMCVRGEEEEDSSSSSEDCIKDGENVMVESQTVNGRAVGKQVNESDLDGQCCSGYAENEGIASSIGPDENGDEVVTRSYHGICLPAPEKDITMAMN